MAYFKDLSVYEYFNWNNKKTKPLNIGWLDKEFEFTKGNVSKEFISKLNELGERPSNLCKGSHNCQFCNNEMGNGEIRVNGNNNIVYVAPIMILHYITKHNYLPPEEFINAVMRTK